MSIEFSIMLLNAVIIILAYFIVYPKVAGQSLNKVALFDCITTSLALIIVANKYWNSGISLSFFTFQVNWFWFTLLTFSMIEVPIALWYFRKVLK